MLVSSKHLVLLLGIVGFSEASVGRLSPTENAELQRTCGRGKHSRLRVLNGQRVSQEEMNREAPWVVSINYESETEKAGPIACTGVLLSPRHVLTAAHCQKFVQEGVTTCHNENLRHDAAWARKNTTGYRIRVGTICGHRDCIDRSLYEYRVRQVIFPASFTNGLAPSYCPTYNGETEDIAIYELTEEVKGAHSICLSDGKKKPMQMHNYGYGVALEEPFDQHFLQKQTVQYTRCMGSQPGGNDCIHHIDGTKTLACSGDSGSPITGIINGRVHSVGILTSGDSCRRVKEGEGPTGKNFDTFGDVITSVPHYLNWICKYTGVCPNSADETKDERPTYIWDRSNQNHNGPKLYV